MKWLAPGTASQVPPQASAMPRDWRSVLRPLRAAHDGMQRQARRRHPDRRQAARLLGVQAQRGIDRRERQRHKIEQPADREPRRNHPRPLAAARPVRRQQHRRQMPARRVPERDHRAAVPAMQEGGSTAHLLGQGGQRDRRAQIIGRHRHRDPPRRRPGRQMAENRAIQRLPVAAVQKHRQRRGAPRCRPKYIHRLPRAGAVGHAQFAVAMRRAVRGRIGGQRRRDRGEVGHLRAVVVFAFHRRIDHVVPPCASPGTSPRRRSTKSPSAPRPKLITIPAIDSSTRAANIRGICSRYPDSRIR